MECISVFDMFKIGVGPSSSHTLGPWKAVQNWLIRLQKTDKIHAIKSVTISLYGSLSLTGRGHATDTAIILGLSGYDPKTCPIEDINEILQKIQEEKKLKVNGVHAIPFGQENIVFRRDALPYHSNAMKCEASFQNGEVQSDTYYSIGGGFIIHESEINTPNPLVPDYDFPFPIDSGKVLLSFCAEQGKSIAEIVEENEKSIRPQEQTNHELKAIWNVMLESMYNGCHTEGELPGGLHVRRRSFDMYKRLMGEVNYTSPQEWMHAIRKSEVRFREILKWVSCFALAVNEVNASLGRVVTAPTNGAAGVIPAVLMYYLVIEDHNAGFDQIKEFLFTASEVGSIFKKGATISAAMGGCQAEIGVSAAMAAAGLTALRGGTPDQILVAAEIAMEHHLGLTCDPIEGLVQIPCIERNSMGAIKAINASELALETDSKNTKVTLDKVVSTMWDTAKDMNSKYKETSEGGLAVKVNISDC